MNRPDATPITSGPLASPAGDTGCDEPTAVAVRGVTFGYGAVGGAEVLSDVSVQLRPGRVTVVLGPNGSGKSTLLRVMLGQLRPWSGTVEVEGRPVEDWEGRALARRMSYVPQRGGSSFGFTVRECLAMGRFAFGDEAYVEEAVAKWGLADVAGRALGELSGGQQQRVLIARAWVQSRGTLKTAKAELPLPGAGGVVLADEPASSLDLRHAQEAMAGFGEMAAEGLAVLVVLHGLELAARWADEVWLMDRGRVVARGEADAVLRPEVLSPVYGVELERLDHGGRGVLVTKCLPGGEAGTL